ncbi:unnamed protein product [Lampetra fluviatilis]
MTAPKMAASCRVSRKTGSLAEVAMVDGPGPPEACPLRGPPRGCPSAVAGVTRVTKSSKTACSELICSATRRQPSSAPGDADGLAPAMTSCTPAASPAANPSAPSVSGIATTGGRSPSSSEESVG